ncbi:tRNA (guanine(37)-N1)-methyltransferase [Elysia marginata]|uniref:tRNA (guanine(37)-N1)-methyltransferase n=1 Tax=Elysia marginata TaxID=1093978 RepID=A0AAV4GRJ5_9GAST|nr:tRNA (guanine(37)-N1)-methyltransferase [Elysia marginata]
MNLKIARYVFNVVKESGHLLHRLDRKTLKIDDRPLSKLRFIFLRLLKEMDDTELRDLSPPQTVKGMTHLKREAFVKSVRVPGLKIHKQEIGKSQKTWKPLVLKIPGLKPVAELSDKDAHRDSHSLILLDPEKLAEGSLLPQQVEMLERLGLNLEEPDKFEVELGYDNWSVADIMRAVLPTGVENVTSFTQVGHIAHLNLKPETLPYKSLIGEVILDKIPSVKTVVNKLNTIDNTYRNFSMELLAGEDNYITQAKEHGCVFELDFSKVYWNSRLATEHQRITELIPKESVVYDVFAGVGPFAIPLAKKRLCKVHANDLNPASYRALVQNIKLNNIVPDNVIASNLDGKEFILTVIKENLQQKLKQSIGICVLSKNDDLTNNTETETKNSVKKSVKCDEDIIRTGSSSYVIMNLPAMAVEFLSNFRGILYSPAYSSLATENLQKAVDAILPQVFCYAFSPKGSIDTELRARVEKALGCPVPADYSTRLVRNVAPNKEMICISFKLWPELVLSSRETDEDSKKTESFEPDEPDSKRQKITND